MRVQSDRLGRLWEGFCPQSLDRVSNGKTRLRHHSSSLFGHGWHRLHLAELVAMLAQLIQNPLAIG